MIHVALQAAEQLAKRGSSAEVIDLHVLRPLDLDTSCGSVVKTHRAVIVEEDWPYGGIGATVAALIQEEAFDELDAPIRRVTPGRRPIPYAKAAGEGREARASSGMAKVNEVLYR